jgi:hypothetical protein
MSEQLKELMGRLADEAGPAPQDPVLWQRARKSRRRDGWVMATVAAVAVLVVTGSAIVGVAAVRDDPPPPADEPTEPRGEPGIPSAIEFPFGDGALELERDLAVGRASVAIANNTAAFVITADDGVYHRLDLPGFDPALYADGGSEVSGLALSPDGTKLVYGWQGTSNSPKESGARLLDLQTGEVTTLARQTLYDEPARLLTWGFSWSPDSRFVVNRVKIADPGDPWASGPHWRQGLDTRPRAPGRRRPRQHQPGGILAAGGSWLRRRCGALAPQPRAGSRAARERVLGLGPVRRLGVAVPGRAGPDRTFSRVAHRPAAGHREVRRAGRDHHATEDDRWACGRESARLGGSQPRARRHG